MDQVDPDLMVKGSRITRYIYLAFPDDAGGVDDGLGADDFEAVAEPLARTHNDLRFDDVEETQEDYGDAVEDLYGFLSLVGFIALLLGGLGVGSAVAVYVRQKIPSVATLRCIGASAKRAFAIHLVQAVVLGVIGAALGAALGIGVQRLIPRVLADMLPMQVETAVHVPSIATGLGVGVTVALLFALLPLLPLRLVPPLLALRPEETDEMPRDPMRYLVGALLLVLILVFARVQTGSWKDSGYYTGGLVAALLVLYATARGIIHVARRFLPAGLPYELRQGLANLHRPHNQTVFLLVSIGLGAFLILTLHQSRTLLMNQLDLASSGHKPNIVLFDIQDPQLAEVEEIVSEHAALIESVPIVSMRIAAVKGRTVAEIKEDRADERPRWALRREYRSTYRDAARDYEKLVRGTFDGQPPADDAPVGVSMERRQAERLDVDLGDSITWDVQGIPVESVVTSIREVDWRQFRANFFAVFPAGVLEDAPKFHVVTTRADSPERIASLQRAVVDRFPNVSVIDVTLVLQVADELLGRVSFAIEFMAFFSILTGVIVLVGSVLTTRFQRIGESALLRTLGASRRQVERIVAVEYLALGLFATLTGALLSIAATWGLAWYRFDTPYVIAPLPLLVTLAVILAITFAVGLLASRGLHDRPPLQVIRAEA